MRAVPRLQSRPRLWPPTRKVQASSEAAGLGPFRSRPPPARGRGEERRKRGDVCPGCCYGNVSAGAGWTQKPSSLGGSWLSALPTGLRLGFLVFAGLDLPSGGFTPVVSSVRLWLRPLPAALGPTRPHRRLWRACVHCGRVEAAAPHGVDVRETVHFPIFSELEVTVQ